MEMQGGRLAAWPPVLAALALTATLAGAGNLLDSGLFDWHAAQPSFIEGGLELLVLLITTFCALRWLDGSMRWLLLSLPVLFFLRRHAVDLALLASSIYCLGIFGGGILAERALRIPPVGDWALDVARRVALGLALLTLCLWTPSLIFGLSFEQVRIAGIALALVGWAGIGIVLKEWRANYIPATTAPLALAHNAAAWSLLLVACLAILARSNVVLYYDAMWYALRPDRVLFGEHGLYSFLGLSTQVHYYPKLFEVAMAPLQVWGDLSFEAGFNAWALILLAISARGLAQASGVSPSTSWLIAASMVCLPATAGAAEAAKGDVLASAFVLFAIHAVLRVTRGRAELLGLVLLFAALASAIRLTALPPLAVLFIATLLVWGARWRDEGRGAVTWLAGPHGLLAALGLAVVLLVHARTLMLSGTPIITNATTQALLDHWGLAVQFPVGGLTGGEPARGWRGLMDLVGIALTPDDFQFHVFKWSGGVWLAALAVCVARLALGPARVHWLRVNSIALAVGALLPVLLSVNSWPVAGGDGNYFIVPAICLVIAACSGLQKSVLLDAALAACTAITLGFFLLTSNWVTGTAAFGWALDRSPFDARDQIDRHLDAVGLGYLADYLATCNRHTRVVGLLPDTGQGFALPIRYEPLQELAWNNAPAMATLAGFERLIRVTGTQLVVMPSHAGLPQSLANPGFHAQVSGYIGRMEAGGHAHAVAHRGDYVVYRLAAGAPLRGCGG